MPLYKAMVVFQGFTNIAEDRFINTFHFIMASEIIADVAAAVNTDLAAFYNSTASGTSIAANMPTFVNRAATTRFYNMDTPAPRVPFIVPWTLAASSGTTPIPEEVAVVCSFHGAPPITPRRRGRVYIGPLNSSCLAADGNGVRVSSSFQSCITTRAKALADSSTEWVIWSPTDQDTVSIAGGFVDNAFDTMRKRGTKPTARSTWAIATLP